MVYSVMAIRFKKPKTTHESVLILGISYKTLWKWGKNGKIHMIRDDNNNRIFDGEELVRLAPRIKKERKPGFSIFPGKK